MSPAEVLNRIEQTVSAERLLWLERVRGLAETRRLSLYLVGGFVRDLLLGLAPDDFDLVLEGDAPAFAHAAARKWGGDVLVHAPFRTATWTTPDGIALDLASARTETYPQPAGLPSVQTPATITQDLRRRDFSITAIALRLDGMHFGELLDPLGGQADLAARTVRILHPLSFRDDPTRVFRAVRYEQRLGLHIAPETLALIPNAPITALSPDRVRHEFELIVREPKVMEMLTRLQKLDVLAQVHAGLGWGEREAADSAYVPQLPWREWRLPSAPEPDALYWALLLRSASESACVAVLARVNVPRAVEQAVLESRVRVTASPPSAIVAALDPLSELGIVAAYVAQPAARAVIHDYLSRLRFIRAAATGDDLIALGLTPGPHFKELLWSLRAARLDGEVVDKAGERKRIDDWMAQNVKRDV
ncbi:MAG: CCA tRNA nucleotidyltransferase [Anaerolineales bacterium]